MDSNVRFKSSIGFIDLLFNILLGFAFLFIVAFLLIKPEAKKKDFDRRAEFVIILEWDHDAADDLDLYVQDPMGDRVSFRLPRVNFMHLDKDDLGKTNDTIVNADGSRSTVMINREVVTIRGITPGEFIINAHYYSTRISVNLIIIILVVLLLYLNTINNRDRNTSIEREETNNGVLIPPLCSKYGIVCSLPF